MASIQVSAGDYRHSQRDDVNTFIDDMVTQHQFNKQDLVNWLDQAEKKQSILDAISRPAEKTKAWKDYRKIFVTDTRTQQGVEFWQKNAATLEKASQQYNVNPEIIVAIIGVETRYGRNKGSYRVIDALSTLGFDYEPRAKFFRKQLKEFFLLAREQGQDPLALTGSYAGAMGYGQFIPSSYRHYAKDFDGDDFADIWNNTDDAIASVANYFTKHKWRLNEMAATRCHIHNGHDKSIINQSKKPTHSAAELLALGYTPVNTTDSEARFAIQELEGQYGAEFWMTGHNFYVITRYNHSVMYALSVLQLSQAIKEKMAALEKES